MKGSQGGEHIITFSAEKFRLVMALEGKVTKKCLRRCSAEGVTLWSLNPLPERTRLCLIQDAQLHFHVHH